MTVTSGDTTPDDLRPVVATSGSNDWGIWVFGAVLFVGAIALFSALSANREAASAPNTLAPDGPIQGRISSPPPLNLPQQERLPPVRLQRANTELLPSTQRNSIVTAPARPTSINRTPSTPAPELSERAPPRPNQPLTLPEPPLPPPPIPSVVYQTPPNDVSGTQSSASGSNSGDRVTAGRFDNPALTVPQGTVIPGVLETALDSTRAGGVRALVQRDVYGFDGTRVLIHRGSRLYGEYEADLTTGQNRALVRWTRLLRPDGVTVALDSPASDPLGRAGIKGKVDGKFFQRFGNALLQSVLDIGVGVATREASDGVVLALPGSTQNITAQQSNRVQPTLKVKHGTSVSVFVARDLDFSTVDR